MPAGTRGIEIGSIRELFRYPVKSMAGEAIESSALGWHGLAGDRRYSFRRRSEEGPFPWLNANRFASLLRYRPEGSVDGAEEPQPTHVVTPSGERLELRSEALRAEIAAGWGGDVDLVRMRTGIFDDALVSVISLATVRGIGTAVGQELDSLRFRPNIVIETEASEAFIEDRWVGGTLIFGEDAEAAQVSLTQRDARCVMVNLDPHTAQADPAIMRALVRLNDNNAGVYGTVVRAGALHVGQRVWCVGPK